jgi:hypothetical protein
MCSYLHRYGDNFCLLIVPDKRIRNIPEVVLVRRWDSRGSGNLEGEGRVRGGAKEGSVYQQPETEVDDSCHKLGGFQVNRRGTKGKKGEERGFGKGRLNNIGMIE